MGVSCRSPSRGAWIETFDDIIEGETLPVAPPRGERGLKLNLRINTQLASFRRSPSRGAWIETVSPRNDFGMQHVAPPRGERGLKRS